MQRNHQDNMTRHQYASYDEFEPSQITRHGRNGMPYAIQSEHRYVPSNVDQPRTGSRGYQDTNDQENDESKQNQRRRVPIACGRCRKRKIRCSGQQGDSGCQNCKTAGNDNCQFNRVLAHELSFAGTDLSFSGLGTMANHLPLSSAGRTQFIEMGMQPAYMMPLSSIGRMPFRQGSLDYPRPAPYGGQHLDYPEDLGYSSMAYPPPPMHHEPLDVGYGSGNIPPPPRHLTPGPPLVHKHQNMSFYEPSGHYPQQAQQGQTQQQLNQYGGPGQTFALPLRSSISSADNHNSFHLQSMVQTLPNPSAPERALPVLPVPPHLHKYESAKAFSDILAHHAATTASVPSNCQLKPLNSSSQLASNDNYMSISTSPDGTITSNSSFNSTDTGTSSQSDMYAASDEWSQDGVQDPSTTHSSTCQQQQHLPSQSQSQMTSMLVNARRSQSDLRDEMDNYHANTAAHNSNRNHPYSLNNESLSSLHTGSTVNLRGSHNLGNNVQDNESGNSPPLASASQHPQARKLSHHHSMQFASVPSSGDSSLSSLPSNSGRADSMGTSAYPTSSLSVGGHDGRSLGASLLSIGQGYEPWDGSPRQAQQQTMNMNRMIDDHGEELRHRTSLQGLSGVRV